MALFLQTKEENIEINHFLYDIATKWKNTSTFSYPVLNKNDPNHYINVNLKKKHFLSAINMHFCQMEKLCLCSK